MRTRTSLLDPPIEEGDITAKPGSKPWALGARNRLISLLRAVEVDAALIGQWTGGLQKHEAYKHLADSKGKLFASWRDFCTAKTPYGLGYDPGLIERVIKEGKSPRELAQQLAADPDVQVQANGRPKKGGCNPPLQKGSTGAARIVAKLKRDAPEVAQALARGEYKSARAAGIAAGIVKVPTPLDLLKRAWVKATKQQRDEIVAWNYGRQAE